MLGALCVRELQATSHTLFTLDLANNVTKGIVASPQITADLSLAPWLSFDFINFRYVLRTNQCAGIACSTEAL